MVKEVLKGRRTQWIGWTGRGRPLAKWSRRGICRGGMEELFFMMWREGKAP